MTNKWMTSGASRLKANLNRSFGARKNKKSKQNVVTTVATAINCVDTTKQRRTTLSMSMATRKNNGRSTTDAIVHHRYNQEGRQVVQRRDATTMLYGQDKFNQFMRQERESTAAAAGAGMAEATIHYLKAAERIRKDELLGLLRKGDTSAAAALATRSIAPPPMLGPPPPPPPPHRRPEDDITTLQTESIEHILTFQEAQAKRERELKHLRHLETMQAAVTFENQSILEEELMLQQRQLQLRSRSERLANLMQHQARSMQHLHQNSMPGVGGFMGRIQSARQQQQSSGEGFNLEVSSTSTSPQKQLCLPPRRRSSPKEDSNCSRKVSLDFATDSNIHKHSNDHAGRSTLGVGGATAVAIRPPSNLRPTSNTVRYWNNGVEVNIHGTPLGSSPLRSRLAAATTTTATANGVTTAAAAAAAAVGMQPTSPSVHVDDSNIISKFAKLVISCVPESTSAISDLLSEFLSTGITSDDLLCVHSKFPGFVNTTLIELKSLEETSKDKEELYERVTSCIAAIEPYKEIATPSSSVYSQLRALTTEGTRLASNVLSQTKKKRRKKRIRTDGVENHSSDSDDDGRSNKKQKPSTSTPHVNILEMYQNKNTIQEDKQKESSEVSNASDDMKSVETKTAAVPASSSVVTSAMSSSEKGGHRRVSDPPLEEEGEDTSIVPKQPPPEAKKTKKISVEQGPHGVLLQQLFGKRD